MRWTVWPDHVPVRYRQRQVVSDGDMRVNRVVEQPYTRMGGADIEMDSMTRPLPVGSTWR